MKLELKDIKKSFGEKEILHGINFSVESGRALGLLGRNGAGKTTTMRIIMDVFRANSGEVLLDGKKFIVDGSMVGYLPEERGLYPKRLIKTQMIYLAELRGMNKKQAAESTKKWLEKLHVLEYADRKLDTLSKGNQQKVQLAATLVGEPDIVILDEPFSGLDPVNAQILKDVINELIADGKIVIFSSHQMSYVEEFCEDIVIINHGDVVLSGNLNDIKVEYGRGRKIVNSTNYSLSELADKFNKEFADMLKVLNVDKKYVIVDINEGVDQWTLLEAMKEKGIELNTYGAYEPSLNDIFVSKVGEEEAIVPAEEKEEETDKKKKGLFRK